MRRLFCRDSATMQPFRMKFLHLLHLNDIIIIILMNFCVLGSVGVGNRRFCYNGTPISTFSYSSYDLGSDRALLQMLRSS